MKELISKIIKKTFFKEKNLLTDSKVFCMAPWVQLHAQTDGKIAPCCMSSTNLGQEIGNLNLNPKIEDAWNSENMREIRKNMLNEKKSSICNNCYHYESQGRKSERNSYNTTFANEIKRINQTKNDGTILNSNILELDIRFNNICNYKCRICSSTYSTQWVEEEYKLGLIKEIPSKKEINPFNDFNTFWNSYIKLLPGLKRIHFAGGEPLIMEDHFKTLNYLLEINNTNVTLSYNTNFSSLKFKKNDIVEIWKQFKQVDIWASLDDYGKRGDYQRKGQNWDTIEKNIQRIQQECDHVLFGINATVSIFNVLYIPEFFKYAMEKKLVLPHRFNLYLLYSPSYFSITQLTPELKDKVRTKYADFNQFLTENYENELPIQNHMHAILNFMDSKNSNERKTMTDMIQKVDAFRNENFSEIFPEISSLLYKNNESI